MGSELQLHNDRVRVTRWSLRADEETGHHRHEHAYVVIPVADADMAVRDGSGSETVSTLAAGVSYFRPAGVEHNVRNPGPSLLDFVEVELLE